MDFLEVSEPIVTEVQLLSLIFSLMIEICHAKLSFLYHTPRAIYLFLFHLNNIFVRRMKNEFFEFYIYILY